jgi:hypothetical protein
LAITLLAAAVMAVAMIADDRRPFGNVWRSSLHRQRQPTPCANVHLLASDRRSMVRLLDAPVREMLEYACEPQAHLAALFQHVTDGAASDLERGVRWVGYIQSLNVSASASLDADGTAIFHPLWLLEHRVMDCGQTARLVVDGFIAAGIPARVLQMRNHVSAEFHAGGKWRFAEADVLTGGEFITDEYGEHASMDEIITDPDLLTGVRPYLESTGDVASGREQFRRVFEATVYPQSPLATPYVIKKSAPLERPGQWNAIGWEDGSTAEAARLTRHYHGWNHYVFCRRSDAACTN